MSKPVGRTPEIAPLRRLPLVAAFAMALAATGCQKGTGADITGSIASKPPSEMALRAEAEQLGKRYDAKPGEKQVSLGYAKTLRALDQRQQAVAVLQTAAMKAPKDTEILSAYGKALAENGDLQQAQEVLSKAHRPERPDWRILSAQGAIADQLGEHDRAQDLYQTALKIQPDDPGVLANYGLSLALAKRLPEAEAALRRAAGQPMADQRVRQNLALVLGLQGRYKEAEEIARQDLSPTEAAASIASIRQMVAQEGGPRSLGGLPIRAAGKTPPAMQPSQAAAATLSPQPAGPAQPKPATARSKGPLVLGNNPG